MSAVIPFLRPAGTRQASWSQQELAEFYRVEAALIRAGIGIATEHGLSDEGEPWFVFCRPDGDAIMHFARIDGSYLIASAVMDRPVRGPDFRAMIDQIARLHPELLPIPAAATGTKLVVHPAALLAALVAAAAVSLSAGDAHAGEIDAGAEASFRPGATGEGGAAGGSPPSAQAKAAGGHGEPENGRKQIEAIILSTMIFAAEALAGDHHVAHAEAGLALLDPASGAAIQLAQGDGSAASGAVSGSGPDAGAIQPASSTAQGSGTSHVTSSFGGKIDAASVTRTDFSGDRAGPQGREAAHHAPGFGAETGPAGTPAEAGGARTASQPTPSPSHADGMAGTADGSGAAGGDQRGASPEASTAASSAQVKSADGGQSDGVSGTPVQTWVNAAGHAVANRAAAAEVALDADAPALGNGQGARVGAVAEDEASGDRDGRGHGPATQVAMQGDSRSGNHAGGDNRASGDDGDRGKAVRAGGEVPPPAAAGGHGHGADPAGKGDPQASASHDANEADPAPVAASHGSGESPAGGQAPGAQAAEAKEGHGQGHADDSGPGAEDHSSSPPSGPSLKAADAASDRGPDDASSGSDSHSHGASAEAEPHGNGNGHGPASSDPHGAAAEAPPHSSAGAEAHGLNPHAANQGPPTQNGGAAVVAQDHSGPDAEAASGGQHNPSEAQASQAGDGPPDHASATHGMAHAASGQDAAARDPAAPGSSDASVRADPAASPQGDAASHSAGPAAEHGGHGSAGTPADGPPASQPQHASADGGTIQTATTGPSSQVAPAQTAAAGAPDHAGSTPEQASPPRAGIDTSGNLVFHGDPHQGTPAPAASHGSVDPGAHSDMGLVGVSDQPHVVHDLYHHT